MNEDFDFNGQFTYDVQDYTIHLGKHSFGFSEVSWSGGETQTTAHFGALGDFKVPVSARAGWAIVITVPLILIAAAAVARRMGKGRGRAARAGLHTQ